jgi:hypothetical protein
MKDQTSPNTMFHEKDMAGLMSLCVIKHFCGIRCEQKDLIKNTGLATTRWKSPKK